MKHSLRLTALASAATLLTLGATSPAAAEQKIRVQVNQRGDFALIGNTLGWDCGAGAANPVVGQVAANCGSSPGDTSVDMFWRSDEPGVGQASATLTTMPAQARSSAQLTLPQGALVTHAFLYWGARANGSAADTAVTFERPGVFSQNVTALSSTTLPVYTILDLTESGVVYQSVADVTALVVTNGPGGYRVSGVDASSAANVDDEVLHAGWSLVVLYRLESEPPRNLTIFDGLDSVRLANNADVSLSGFLVPNAGFDAKLGTIVYEGDEGFDGDSLLFGTAPLDDSEKLSDAQNPADNFFNGTRSWLGSPVSVMGDLPQLAGTASTMAGIDLDVVDVTKRLSAGQTRADMRATSSLDSYYLGAFITSISTFRPDFISSEKKVRDVNGGYVQGGDELEYSIIVKNSGNDASARTVVVDPLPSGVAFVPGSVQITTGPNAGAKTDASGDDQAFFDATARSLTVYMGTGATATAGGSLAVAESSTFTFRVKVDANLKGLISNQARVEAGGARGAPSATTLTDGNADGPGNPPTDIPAGECTDNNQCGGDKPFCNLIGKPPICVECTMDSQCKGPTTHCELTTGMCVCPLGAGTCIDTDGDGLSDSDEGMIGTDPKDADSDDDGLIDGKEPKPGEDADGDGKKNALDPDSDNDGLFDGTELGEGCSNPATNLSKMQCRADGDNGVTKTDPLNPDTDGGKALDGAEDTDKDGVVDAGERDPTTGHAADDGKVDTDGDGLSDESEDGLGTDKNDADTDDDGVRDGDEDHVGDDTDGDGKINALDPDSDGDGIFDGTEQGKDCADPATNRAKNYCVPDADMGKTVTSPVNRDSDAGGIADGDEDKNHNGAIDSGESDPNKPCDDNERLSCDVSPVEPGFGSLAGAGGCALSKSGGNTLSGAMWLLGVFGVLYVGRRRFRNRS